MAEERTCTKCGNKLNDDELFCGECGCKYKAVDNNSTDEPRYFGSLTLTRDYVYQSHKKIGGKYAIYIFLKDISSIEISYKSHPIFIVLTIITAMLGLIGYNLMYILPDDYATNISIIASIVTIIFIILFFVTRFRILSIKAHNKEQIIEKYSGGSEVEKFAKILVNAKQQAI